MKPKYSICREPTALPWTIMFWLKYHWIQGALLFVVEALSTVWLNRLVATAASSLVKLADYNQPALAHVVIGNTGGPRIVQIFEQTGIAPFKKVY